MDTSTSADTSSSSKKKQRLVLSSQVQRIITQDEYLEMFQNQSSVTQQLETLSKIEVEDDVSEYVSIFKQFILNEAQLSLALDGVQASRPSSSSIRAKLHSIADSLGMGHESTGTGENRHLVITKQAPIQRSNSLMLEWSVTETYFFDIYIGLRGPFIDQIASKYEKFLPGEIVQKRVDRDGNHHHMTLISGKSLKHLKIPIQSAFEKISAIPDNWKPVGIGSVSDSAGFSTFFVVVSWPDARAVLDEMGIYDQHFHITLGFQNQDIHGVAKDESTLVEDVGALMKLKAHHQQKDHQKDNQEDHHQQKPNQEEEKNETSKVEIRPRLKRIPRQPGQPKRPLTAFMMYASAARTQVKAQYPDVGLSEIIKKIAEQWKDMADDEKQVWQEKAMVAKQEYEAQMVAWNQSMNSQKESTKENKKNDDDDDDDDGSDSSDKSDSSENSENSENSDSSENSENSENSDSSDSGGNSDESEDDNRAPVPTRKTKLSAGRPQRPRSAFMIYSVQRGPQLRSAHPDWKIIDITKKLGAEWKDLPEAEKKVFYDMALQEKNNLQAQQQ